MSSLLLFLFLLLFYILPLYYLLLLLTFLLHLLTSPFFSLSLLPINSSSSLSLLSSHSSSLSLHISPPSNYLPLFLASSPLLSIPPSNILTFISLYYPLLPPLPNALPNHSTSLPYSLIPYLLLFPYASPISTSRLLNRRILLFYIS